MREMVILLDDFRFDYEKQFVERVFSLFDKGFKPTEVQEILLLDEREIFVFLGEYAVRKGRL